MGSYARVYSLSDGTTAYGSQVASELDALGSSVNNIVNAQVASGAGIIDTKLAQISTAGKVSGAAITLLTSVPSGAGELPAANLNIATQAEQETGTATDTVVVSGVQKYHPSAAKAWCSFDGTQAGGSWAIATGFNVDSTVTDNGNGDYTISFTTDFSSANYAWAAAAYVSGTKLAVYSSDVASSQTAGALRFMCGQFDNGTATNASLVSLIAFGDQ